MKKNKLYVLLLPQMDKDRKLCYSIKFGYSKDFDKVRKPQYQSYFWNFEILHVYDDGDVDIEEKIIYYLKDYVLFGREWFRYCPEVLNFFNKNDTYEKLKAVADTVILPTPSTASRKKIRNKVNLILVGYIYEKLFKKKEEDLIKLGEIEKSIIETLGDYKPEDQVKFAIKKYLLDEEDLLKHLKNKENISKVSSDLANDFNKLKDVVSKLKFLVDVSENKTLSKEDINNFLDLIPPRFKGYYLIMGPDRIKAHGSMEARLKKEWINQHKEEEVNEELINEILEYFKIGHRYSNQDAKAKLKELYEKYNYEKTAKASDLGEYFCLKNVYDPSTKKNGFEILSRK